MWDGAAAKASLASKGAVPIGIEGQRHTAVAFDTAEVVVTAKKSYISEGRVRHATVLAGNI
jgi:hypothetical protein